jgi:hypothetical protein
MLYFLELRNMVAIDLQSHEGFYGTDDEDSAPD